MDDATAAAFARIETKLDKLPCLNHEGRIASNSRRLENGKDYEERDLQKKATRFSGYRILIGVCAVIITVVEILAKVRSWN